MKIYKVAVTEIYRKVVSVPANSEQEAHQRAWDAWNNTEIILDNINDFEGAEMSVLGELGEGLDVDGEKLIAGFNYRKGTAKNER